MTLHQCRCIAEPFRRAMWSPFDPVAEPGMIHRECNVTTLSRVISIALSWLLITPDRYRRAKELLGFRPVCRCPQNAEKIDRWLMTSPVAAPLRRYVRNYAGNLRWLRGWLPRRTAPTASPAPPSQNSARGS